MKKPTQGAIKLGPYFQKKKKKTSMPSVNKNYTKKKKRRS